MIKMKFHNKILFMIKSNLNLSRGYNPGLLNLRPLFSFSTFFTELIFLENCLERMDIMTVLFPSIQLVVVNLSRYWEHSSLRLRYGEKPLCKSRNDIRLQPKSVEKTHSPLCSRDNGSTTLVSSGIEV